MGSWFISAHNLASKEAYIFVEALFSVELVGKIEDISKEKELKYYHST